MTAEHDDTLSCPECGRTVKKDDRFCLACGTVLGAGKPATTVSPFAPTQFDAPEGATRVLAPESGATRLLPVESSPDPGATRMLPANTEPPPPQPQAVRAHPIRAIPVAPVRPVGTCRRCGEPLTADDLFCPACGCSTSTAAPSRKGLWLIGIGGALAALIVGGVVLASPFIFGSGFHTAEYLPADTWMYGTLTMRPGLLQTFHLASVVDAFTAQPGFDDAVRALTPQSSSASASRAPTATVTSGAALQDDLYKLVDGEVALGVSGSAANGSAQYVMFMHSSSPDALLRRVMSIGGTPSQTTQYRGIPVWDYGSQYNSPYGAVSGAWVVLGYPRRGLEQSLDLMTGVSTDNLDKQPSFRNVVNRLPGDKLGFTYVNSDRILTNTGARTTLAMLGPDVRNYLEPLSVDAAMSAAATGDGLELRYESIPITSPVKRSTANTGSAVSALEQLPRDTLVGIGGDNLPALLEGANQSINAALQTSMGPRAPRVQVDVQSWLAGEFALGLTAGDLRLDNRSQQTGQASAVLVAKVKDSTAANRDIQSLDSIVKPSSATISGISMRRVGPSYAGATAGYYGVSNDWFYLLSGTSDTLVTARGAPSLQTNGRYASIRDSLVQDGIVLFADGEGARKTAEGLLTSQALVDYQRKVQPFIQPIRALGGSLKTDDSGDIHGTLKLSIKK